MSLYPLFGKFRFPNLKNLEKRTFNFSGTLLTISVPPFSSKWGQEEKYGNNINIFDKKIFIDIKDSNALSLQCFKTDWTIKSAPFFSSNIGHIYFSISIMFWKNEVNLLNCSSLENELIEGYTRDYGDNGKFSSDSFEAFTDWKTDIINGHEWISYSIKSEGLNSFTNYLWRTPISDQHILTLNFCTDFKNEDPNLRETIVSFCQSIAQTSHFSPSVFLSDIKQKYNETYPTQSYSKNMKILRWVRSQEMSLDEFLDG